MHQNLKKKVLIKKSNTVYILMKNERAKKIISSVLDFYLFICVWFKKKRNFESSFATE